MPEGVRWTSPGGGPILWLELPKKYNLQKIIAKMIQQNISIRYNDIAFFGKPHLHGFSIGYASLSQKIMQESLEKLSQELK